MILILIQNMTYPPPQAPLQGPSRSSVGPVESGSPLQLETYSLTSALPGLGGFWFFGVTLVEYLYLLVPLDVAGRLPRPIGRPVTLPIHQVLNVASMDPGV